MELIRVGLSLISQFSTRRVFTMPFTDYTVKNPYPLIRVLVSLVFLQWVQQFAIVDPWQTGRIQVHLV